MQTGEVVEPSANAGQSGGEDVVLVNSQKYFQ